MRKKISALLFVTFTIASIGVYSQRHSTRLNSGWEYMKGDLGGAWEAVRSVGRGSPESVPQWKPVTLPHCFNAYDAVDPDQPYYQGPGWYRSRLPINNPFFNGRTLLHFEGAGQKTDVYVYLTKVGSHVGGYDEWTVDITEAVEQFKETDLFKTKFNGTVPITIRCDNSRDLEMIPSSLSDFNLYGGIYRYLNLEYVPSLSIANVLASQRVEEDGSNAILNIQAAFVNAGSVSSAQLEIFLKDEKGNVVDHLETQIDPSQKFQWKKEIRKPALWSPSKPALYTIAMRLHSNAGNDECEQKIGFRWFEFKDQGPFYLNDERLLLRGTHRHEDHSGVGAAMTENLMRKEMIMMKEMGVNFIRLGHYQQSRIILDLCDSLGILVWEEIPWCRGGLGGDKYKEQARRMLANMIGQHYNHPSVIIWGLGNENDWPGDFPEFNKERIRAFMQELNDLSHILDPSRKTAIRRCDFCKDIVDVYSPSIWAGWYRGRYTEYKDESERWAKKVDHFIHAEWGGDSQARRHSEEPENIMVHVKTGNGVDERSGDAAMQGGEARFSRDGDWSETYVCDLIDWYLKEQETMPWLTGTAYWPFKDFSTPGRPDNPVPYVNQKGVVERDFAKKESYYVFQSYWTEKPMVHIYGHTWPTRWGASGEMKMVKVYSNADEAELFVNGKSAGVRKRNSQDFPAAGLRWMIPMTEGKYHLRVVARKGKVKTEDEITQFYQTAKWSKPVQLTVQKIYEKDDTVTVEARLLDEANINCLDARNWIHFSLTGDGKLIDDLGTSSGSRKVQAYNGRAIISAKKNNGQSILAIQSPGIPTVFLDLDRKPETP
ncbi:MAG TPA: glycoside hydrolase family 2 TIM barrel-domain containing protein [Cyclobacteriaceae bacterium]|nr:glycoside hydrolase family 2 TIM barrel-domain containing protein [Cyclobacteriaceae bacterium]